MHLLSVWFGEMAKIRNSDLTCELQVIEINEHTPTLNRRNFQTKIMPGYFIF
jgi:hypothetical protein